LRRIYWDAHWQNLALHAVRMGTRLAVQARGAGSVAESPLAVTIVKGLLWPGTVGTGLWYVGEVVFLVSFRPFPMDEAGDLVAFLLGGIPVGPALYYFLVYRNHEAFRPGACGGSAKEPSREP